MIKFFIFFCAYFMYVCLYVRVPDVCLYDFVHSCFDCKTLCKWLRAKGWIVSKSSVFYQRHHRICFKSDPEWVAPRPEAGAKSSVFRQAYALTDFFSQKSFPRVLAQVCSDLRFSFCYVIGRLARLLTASLWPHTCPDGQQPGPSQQLTHLRLDCSIFFRDEKVV